MIQPKTDEILDRTYVIEICKLSEIRTDLLPNTRWLSSYDLDPLIESIRSVGLLEPLIVRDGPGGLDLICGHRRYAALVALHEQDAPCRIVRATDAESRQLNAIENLARKTLDPPEAALAVEALHEDGSSLPEIARMTGKKLATIQRWILLRRGLTRAMWDRFCIPVDTIANGITRKDYRETLFSRVAKHKPVDQAAMLAIFEAEAEVKKGSGRPKGAKDSRPRGAPVGLFLSQKACLAIAQWIEDCQQNKPYLWNAGAEEVWKRVSEASKLIPDAT